MEMEGRSYSEFYTNTSEELFIKTMMEGSSIGMQAPTMEMLGFKNLTQNLRTDSEELFKSWLRNGENNGCHSIGIGHRPRQTSRRISTELSCLANQSGVEIQEKPNDGIPFPPTTSMVADTSNDFNITSTAVEKGMQATNLFLAKAWFQSSQPMTRSRSSELRRRYVAMQNSQTFIGIEAMNQASGNIVNNFSHEPPHGIAFNNISTNENSNQFSAFVSPTNSSSSTFNNHPQMGSIDNISSVVSMLKGTLERKRLINQVEIETIDDGSYDYYNAQQVLGNIDFSGNQGTYQDASTIRVGDDNGVLQAIEESLMEDITGPSNLTQIITISPSQSESSAAAAHIVSNGFDMFEDSCFPAQGHSVSESSRNQMRNGMSPEECSKTKGTSEYGERMNDNSKYEKKKGGLIRYGSQTSTGSVDRGDPTKKRRVERSRKMAEAKEKSSTPAIPSDMQSVLKRCENLEKEVRSLKLNLAFMNRKDSEQTKQIEELEKLNQDLGDEKERLLEEIERIIAETGQM